jgi:hypothetical protein
MEEASTVRLIIHRLSLAFYLFSLNQLMVSIRVSIFDKKKQTKGIEYDKHCNDDSQQQR